MRKVTLTDGEPAIYPRVLESIRYCMTRGLDVTILTNGEGCVIPCNALPNVRLGRIHEDFSDRESFWKFWSSREVADRLSAIRSVPDARCDSCGMFDRCRGGCVSNWLDFSFEDSVFSNGD